MAALACRAPQGDAPGASAPGGDGPAPLERGIALIQQGEAQAGVEELGAALPALEGDEQRALALTWMTHASTVLGDYEAARDHALAALALTPEDPWLHYALGLARLGVGDDDGAVLALTRSAELDPAPIKALQWRAEVHKRNDRWEAARADCELALEVIAVADEAQLAAAGGTRAQLEYETRFTLARALDGLKRYAEAEVQRERARALTR